MRGVKGKHLARGLAITRYDGYTAQLLLIGVVSAMMPAKNDASVAFATSKPD